MALTKVGIAEKIQKDLGISKAKSSNIVESVLNLMKETLAGGEDVLISRFGKFCVKEKDPRIGRNPATDEELVLRKRKVVTFKCSGNLRNQINGK